MDKRNEFRPSAMVHPGVIVARELKERGIKQKDFAKNIGMEPTCLDELLKGKRPISEKAAAKIGDALGISSVELRDMQNRYSSYLSKINGRKDDESQPRQGNGFLE